MAALGGVAAGAKLFLLSGAIVDDIITVGVIAIAYTGRVDLGRVAAAGGGLVVVAVMRASGAAAVPPYVPVGVFVWYATPRAADSRGPSSSDCSPARSSVSRGLVTRAEVGILVAGVASTVLGAALLSAMTRIPPSSAEHTRRARGDLRRGEWAGRA
jgi:Na+/H+ antiporter NhaA